MQALAWELLAGDRLSAFVEAIYMRKPSASWACVSFARNRLDNRRRPPYTAH